MRVRMMAAEDRGCSARPKSAGEANRAAHPEGEPLRQAYWGDIELVVAVVVLLPSGVSVVVEVLDVDGAAFFT